MFPNLKAEQARRNLTNSAVAEIIGIKADGYGRRIRTGRFLASECLQLCKMFNCSFEYLFATDEQHSA